MTSRGIRALLALAVALPAWAVAWGRDGGEVAFVLYRQPKLVALFALLPLLLAGLLVHRRRDALPHLSTLWLKPPLEAVALLLVAYMALSGLWVTVEENWLAELRQYTLLVLLLVALRSWFADDSQALSIARLALVLSFAPITLLGLAQLGVAIPWLAPINPHLGAVNPSLMGYKNPMALSLLGQLFVLAYLVARPPGLDRLGGWARLPWGLLLLLELGYLATLRSRTAYLALTVGVLAGLVVGMVGRRRRGLKLPRRVLAAIALAAALFAGVAALYPPARERIASMAPYLTRPSAYWESDRGTYLRNTLGMVAAHPFGVGLGDWQTFYPVFRAHNRTVSFDERFQVRRAHSDHVQMLGELGWQGALLWGGLLALAIGLPWRHALRHGDLWGLFAGAQMATLAAAMVTDYFVEVPYNKLQFFLLLSLLPPHAAGRVLAAPRYGSRGAWSWGLVGALLVGFYGITAFAEAKGSFAAARLGQRYLQITGSAEGQLSEAAARQLLRGPVQNFLDHPTLSKTRYRDWMILAHVAHATGQPAKAEAAVRQSLALHPYHPNAFRFLALIWRGERPADALGLQKVYVHVMEEATHGFELPYPLEKASDQDDNPWYAPET